MKSQRKYINPAVDVAELYAIRLGAVWSELKKQHISYWMLCFYYFFEYVRPQTQYPVLDVLPWPQIFLLATFFSAFFNTSIKWVNNPANKLLLVFYFVLVLSGIFAFIPMSSWDERNLMIAWLLVYFLTINIVNTEKKLIVFLLIYFLFNFKMSQHGAIEWASRGFSFAGWGLVGSPGFFRNSGEYAIQMIIFGSLAISFVLSLNEYWGRYKKWLFYLAAATGYMAVMGSSSRGAQLALACIGVWILLKYKWGFKGLITTLVIFAALYTILPDEQLQRFYDIGDDKDSQQRLAYWQYGLSEVIPKHPVLGVGYKNWLQYVRFKVPEGMGPYEIVEEPHNIFIQAAAELGFSGLSMFVALVICAFILNARTRIIAKRSNNRLLYNLAFGLDAGLIGYLVAGSFVSVFYYPFFWVQLSMIVMVNSITVRQSSETFNIEAEKRPRGGVFNSS